MTNTRTTALTLAIMTSTALGLSACSGSSDTKTSASSGASNAASHASSAAKDATPPNAKDAWSKAQDTVGTYKTLEIKGEGKEDGQPTTMTMKGAVNGEPIEVDGESGGNKLSLVSIDKKNYIKADAGFWQKSSGIPKAQAEKFDDKWVVEPQKDASDSMSDGFTDVIKEIRDDSSAANKKLLSGKATISADKVGDQDAWKITSEDKKVTVWLAQDAGYDILKSDGLSEESADDMHTTTYVSHDKDYGITAPAGAKSAKEIAGS